jgi:MoaA/NifB/PqqE/SkfB family radical SAM enzyme
MWERIRLAFTRKTELAQPIQLIVFVTDRCNARCSHCFNWRALNQGDELTLEEMQHLSGEVGELLTLGISGGEPFLRQDLAAVYELFSWNNNLREIDIPTNGLLPERVRCQVKGMLDQDSSALIAVTLSLDGLSELHDRIRGVAGSFAKLQETYHALVTLKREYPNHPPLIKVGTTLCNWNIRQIPDLTDWVQNEMPMADFHNFEIMRGEPRDGQIGPPSVKDLEWIRPHIFRVWKQYSFYGRGLRFQSWLALGLKRYIFETYIEMLRQKKQLIPCYAARTSAVVDAQGNLYFCELRESIGNLREASLQELWYSERAESTRNSIERGDCYCVHSCFQQKNVFLNPRMWPHVVFYLLTGRFTLPPASHIQPRRPGSIHR